MDRLLGNYADLAERTADACRHPGSFLAEEWDDPAIWQRLIRGKVFELLSYNPPKRELNARLIRRFSYGGVQVELVAWDQPYGPPTEAYFLKPLETPPGVKLPAVAALHDHGGFKYYGKEKLTALPDEPEILREFKNRCYQGVSWATRLAKRGYGVLVPDIFLWGSRKMIAEEVPSDFTEALREKKPGSGAYIEAYHEFCRDYETIVAKSLFMAGTTWPGIMLYEDMRAIEYLASRGDVDRNRIACGGFSGGGEQTIYLAGLDSRISCAVCVCFMTTFAQTVRHNIQSHTWMFHLPHLAKLLDLPDLISLSGGIPVQVQYGQEDSLFADKGKQESHEKLRRIYEKIGRPERYEGRFYPGGHQFNIAMQDDAFMWFDRWLK
ncbi:MAG: dienelactone hydrolase family protein [Spirochaetaceae bacterium]|jgi:dienelactone hydrolase|nr:dienelactone hydrolase family protein [Spirochaetaceae bacterium]